MPCPTSIDNGAGRVYLDTDIACDQIVLDDGFIQQRVTAGGESFYQYAVTEAGASGAAPTSNLDFTADTLAFSVEQISPTQSTTLSGTGKTSLVYGVSNVASSETVAGIETRHAQRFGFEVGNGGNHRNGFVAVDTAQELSVIDWNQTVPEELLRQTFSVSELLIDSGGGFNAIPRDRNFNRGRRGSIQQTVALGDGDKQGFIKKYSPTLSSGSLGRHPDLWVGQYRANPSADSQFSPFSYTQYNTSVVQTGWNVPDCMGGVVFYPLGSPIPSPPCPFYAGPNRRVYGFAGGQTALSFTDANPAIDSIFFNNTGSEVFLKENYSIARRTPTAWTDSSSASVAVLDATSPFLANNGNSAYGTNQTNTASTAPVSPTNSGGAPAPLNDWTVVNGVISAPCPPGATCDSVIGSGAGFLMRGVTIAGIEYIQTIITESNATGVGGSSVDGNESFVRADGVAGIAATQFKVATDSYVGVTNSKYYTLQDPLNYRTTLNQGWALTGPGDAALTVLMDFNADLADLSPATIAAIGPVMQFSLRVAANGALDYTIYDRKPKNLFYFRKIDGGIQNTSHVADLLNPALSGGGIYSVGSGTIANCKPLSQSVLFPGRCLGTAAGADLSWNAGDSLAITQISSGWGNSPGGDNTRLNQASITNLSTGERAQTTRFGIAYNQGWQDPTPFDMPTLPETYTPRF